MTTCRISRGRDRDRGREKDIVSFLNVIRWMRDTVGAAEGDVAPLLEAQATAPSRCDAMSDSVRTRARPRTSPDRRL
ncbi:hypothetical protein B484DRAFT_75468 [Ochromonadaceae sp. CCMP2298]|nr:hypothetical protein B484DRAFT_75468 [Ochromonadaceae sp. CCMP2298]